MLFRNLKTGNMVSATDEVSIELMEKSPIYVAIKPSENVVSKAKRKSGAKNPAEDNMPT